MGLARVTEGPAAAVLALNPGSSSLKAALRTPAPVATWTVDRLGTDRGTLTASWGEATEERPFTGDMGAAVAAVADDLRRQGPAPEVVAHRVVHGGPDHVDPTRVDDALLADLRRAVPLAPLHLPAALESLGRARAEWPDADHVACFDTGFHRTLPEEARRLPVPDEVADLGVRRYGFHGPSLQSVVDRHPDLGNAVVAHLGSGCSVTAVAGGRSVFTTMSLTPTGGMVSATRSGDLDPEVVLFLWQEHGWSADRVRTTLDRSSGLAGLAGGRHDVRDLLAADDDGAALALAVLVADAARAVAACATALRPWEALVFTGGIGEHAGEVRDRICRHLVGVRGGPDQGDPVAALEATGVRVLVVPADEESVLDRLARRLTGR